MSTMEHIVLFGIMISSCLCIPLDYDNNIQIDPHSWLVTNKAGGTVTGNENRNVPKGCGGKPADVYFVFDTSRDITPSQLAQQKYFAKDLLQLFHFGEDTTRVGTIIYGETAKLQIRLDDTGDENYIKESLDKTNSIVGGNRNVYQAIRYVRKQGFSPERSRSGVGQVAIVFTGGEPSNYRNAMLQAQLAKRQGIYLYLVGPNMSNSDFRKKLSYLASQPSSSFVYSIGDYTITNSLITLLRIHLCDVQIYPPVESKDLSVCQTKRPVDLIFSVDEISIGARNSQKIFHLIEAMASELSKEFVNIALVNSRNIIFGKIGKRFEDVDVFTSKLGNINVPDHSDMLLRTRRMTRRGRPGVQKTAIHFIDENVDITKQTLVEAKHNKASKVETYVIAVGESLDMESVNAIASGPSRHHVIPVRSYQLLVGKWKDVLGTVCKGW